MPKRKYCSDCPLLGGEFFTCSLGYTIEKYKYSDDCKLIRIECDDRVILPNTKEVV